MNLNELRDQVHANAVEKGFWDKPLSDSHCLMLVITELSEAVEADRKSKRADVEAHKLLSQASIERTGNPEYFNWVSFKHNIKDSVEDELSDAFIRLLDLAGARNVNVYTVPMELMPGCHVFTEHIYHICAILTDWTNRINDAGLEFQLSQATSYISAYCERKDIDLMWHIEQKMKYNQSRERMHGKKY